MDLKEPCQPVLTPIVARVQQATANQPQAKPADATKKLLRNPNPGVSSLTDEQRDHIKSLLRESEPLSYYQIAKLTGAKYAAVKHLADQLAIDTGTLANHRLRTYERRLGKRLPVKERVEVYAAVARGQVEGSRAADRLRALERIEALEGIVTAREQRESESNQVHVGPLFVLPAQASPVIDIVPVNVRPSQDES